MSLIKWKPLNNEIDTFDNIIDQFFNDLSYDPRFSLMNTNNVSNYYNENEKEYYLTMDVPGMSKNDVEVTFDSNRLKFQDKESLINIIRMNMVKWKEPLVFLAMLKLIKYLLKLTMGY